MEVSKETIFDPRFVSHETQQPRFVSHEPVLNQLPAEIVSLETPPQPQPTETTLKESLLKKTHHGLRIYAHVLQQYYPGETVLSLSGRGCQPAKNPFNGNKCTLYISIDNGEALHYDSEKLEFKGDAFSFAAIHYRIEGEVLYQKLNEEMHLHLGERVHFYNPGTVVVQQAALPVANKDIPVFSYFKNPVTNIFPSRQINLPEVYHLIKGEAFIAETNTLRNISDPKKAKEYKATHFDYVTFSGTFSKRCDKALQKHSGLVTIDLDHLQDTLWLKERLLADEYFETELMFISPSGNGLKWIVAIDLSKASHNDYFKSISNYLLHSYRVSIDASGKDISRACFLPHDAGVYLNPKYL